MTEDLINLKLRIKNFIEERNLKKYPLLISYRRSGSHWICAIMELYFDRPRLRRSRRTFLDKSRTDWLFMHDHDLKFKVFKNHDKKKNRTVLYLYRNLEDVAKSDKIFLKNKYGLDVSMEKLLKECKNHQEKYLRSHWVIPIKYENFLDPKKRIKEFKIITDFFYENLDKKRLEEIFERVGKVKVDSEGTLWKTSHFKGGTMNEKNNEIYKKTSS